MASRHLILVGSVILWLIACIDAAQYIQSFNIPNEAAMKQQHRTNLFRTNAWYIARRGEPVTMRVVIDSEFGDDQSLTLQVSPYSIFDLSTIAITSAGRLSYDITVNIRNDAPIGAFNVAARLTDKTSSTPLAKQVAVIFNPWNPNDAVYYPNTAELDEYINNEHGITYRGSSASVQAVRWYFGQFDHNIMRVLLHQVNRLDERSRSDPALVARFLTSAMTAQETNPDGLMVGRWEGGYPNGVNPLAWSTTEQIVNRYIAQGFNPVQYSQCWVFAAVLNSFLRAAGIPARHESNFDSAHEVPKGEGNFIQEIYRYWDPWSRRLIAEIGQIWNFHAWNSVWLKHNHTLPKYQYAHWHKVDGTPQEHSGGRFQLGPASLHAVRDQVKTTFDTSFVISEVGSRVRNFNARCPWLPGGKLKYLPQGCVVVANLGVEARVPSGTLLVTKQPGRRNWKSDTITNQYHHRNTGVIAAHRGGDYVFSTNGGMIYSSGDNSGNTWGTTTTTTNNGWGNNNGWSTTNNGWGNNNNGWSNTNSGWGNNNGGFRVFSRSSRPSSSTDANSNTNSNTLRDSFPRTNTHIVFSSTSSTGTSTASSTTTNQPTCSRQAIGSTFYDESTMSSGISSSTSTCDTHDTTTTTTTGTTTTSSSPMLDPEGHAKSIIDLDKAHVYTSLSVEANTDNLPDKVVSEAVEIVHEMIKESLREEARSGNTGTSGTGGSSSTTTTGSSNLRTMERKKLEEQALQTSVSPRIQVHSKIEPTIVGEPISVLLRVDCKEPSSVLTEEEEARIMKEDWGSPHRVIAMNEHKKHTKVCVGSIPVSLAVELIQTDYRGVEISKISHVEISTILDEKTQHMQILQLIKKIDTSKLTSTNTPLSQYIQVNTYLIDQSSVHIPETSDVRDLHVEAEIAASSQNGVLTLPRINLDISKSDLYTSTRAGRNTMVDRLHEIVDTLDTITEEAANLIREAHNPCITISIDFSNPLDTVLHDIELWITVDGIGFKEDISTIGDLEARKQLLLERVICSKTPVTGNHVLHVTLNSRELPPIIESKDIHVNRPLHEVTNDGANTGTDTTSSTTLSTESSRIWLPKNPNEKPILSSELPEEDQYNPDIHQVDEIQTPPDAKPVEIEL